MRIAIAALLIVHGLITAAISTGSFRPGEPIINPSWLGWWPTNLGESWLLSNFNVAKPPFTWLLGVGWLIGGLLLLGAGLALLDIFLPQELWRQLAILGGIISLGMLLVYLHPFYLIGIALSASILVALLWARWSPAELAGP